jgi:DNA (cytosine-5)-methyltransferase 1
MGWKPVGFSEIEKFPSQVLAHHYPQVQNFGDMTKYKEWKIDSVGLLVGGTPCQSFSVAGLRKGLSDPRGNLALTYVGILDHFRPKWFIWENVPGVLSSNQGRDFAAFLTSLGIIGYGWSYRVLDAQYFGVAQRRRRVFVVGHLGDWRPAAEVLFESESLSRNTKSSRKKREETSRSFIPSIASTLQTTCNDYSRADGFNMIVKPVSFDERNIRSFTNSNFKTFPTLAATDYKGAKAICYENHPSDSRVREMGDVCQTVTSSWGTGGGNVPFVQSFGWQNSSSQSMNTDSISPTLDKSKTPAVAIPYDLYQITSPLNGQRRENGDPCHTLARDNAAHASIVTNNPIAWDAELNANENKMGTLLRGGQGGRTDGVMMANMAVRRLTPIECERLQGFPDGYTDIKPNGKETPDGHRYKALGNSMAVPVMRWIGERINSYETMRSKAAVQVETGLGIAEV